MFDFEKIIKAIAEAPSRVLDKTVDVIIKDEKALIKAKPFRKAEEYIDVLGPGLVTGAADDDPSGIATYSQAGAQYGFQLIWLSLFTFPFMAMVQEMCARIGIVTGRGLAGNIRHNYSRKILLFIVLILFLANTLNIAANLGAMAAATKLLIPEINFIWCITVFALIILFLQIFTTYAQYSKILKYLTLGLFAYVFTAFSVNLDWREVFSHMIVPSITFSKEQIFLLCAILGTTISPYLFFWQTSQEVEEQILKGELTIKLREENVTPREIHDMRKDTWSGMFFSNAIMFFIIAACAGTLYANGITNIETASQAAEAIKPFAGELTYFFFALGIVGTGLLAIPTMAGSVAYATAESFGWKQGLYHKLKDARAFYGIIIISMLVATIANYFHIDPIKGLIYSAVANGLVAPVVLFFIVRISSNKQIMGEKKNHPFITACGWLTTIVMAIVGFATISIIFF
ncbi:MAG: Nramp family divalent metal transporter [Candidatus Staskawiczbacteria bacterium]|jgi:NRAMP (natural resistance-associated macrophage protein)-like metal ion transporter